MILSEKQHGVLRGMAIGALAAVLLIVLGVVLNPFGYRPDVTISERLSIAVKASAFLCLFVAVSVGRLAKHRFFAPEDIDGGGPTLGSDRAKLLQAILQNTLEQSVLAALVYLSWAILMPWSWLSVIPLAALAFSLIPHCRPGVSLRWLVTVGLIVLALLIAVFLLALGSTYLYALYLQASR